MTIVRFKDFYDDTLFGWEEKILKPPEVIIRWYSNVPRKYYKHHETTDGKIASYLSEDAQEFLTGPSPGA